MASKKRFIVSNQHAEKSRYLTTKLEEKEREKNDQVRTLMHQLDKMNEEASNIERYNLKKLEETAEQLAEKDTLCEALTKRVREMEVELQRRTEENNRLLLSINASDCRNKDLELANKARVEKDSKDREKAERELLEEVGSLKEENLFLKRQIQEMKVQQSHLEEKVTKLKENSSKLETASREARDSYKDQIASLNKIHSETVQDVQVSHEKQIFRLREEFESLEQVLKQKILLLESRNEKLEQELKDKNTQIISERSRFEESQSKLEEKLKADHELIRKQLEEQIGMLEESNKEQNEHLQKNLQVLYQLKTDITGLDLELAEQNHEIVHLRKTLEEKDAEMKSSESKYRLEVNDKLHEIDKAKEKIATLDSEIVKLQREIAERAQAEQRRASDLRKALEPYLRPASGDASRR